VRHGYTNVTERDGAAVTKVYAGPAAVERAEIERRALARLAGQIPVPEVLGVERDRLTMAYVPGGHGQDLLDAGFAADVLAGCGHLLRRLQNVDPTALFDRDPGGAVIVHGDFGPNNVLFAPDCVEVTAVLDWEFCHPGDPIEDLAWCEWIVRAHHPAAVNELPSLFRAYGSTPQWSDRQDAMVRRCIQLEQFCREWDPSGPGVRSWIRRRQQVGTWRSSR
jgi:aminoglycoside phosphotransferase (APT) family kinase protein